jgi:hypothetical protein
MHLVGTPEIREDRAETPETLKIRLAVLVYNTSWPTGLAAVIAGAVVLWSYDLNDGSVVCGWHGNYFRNFVLKSRTYVLQMAVRQRLWSAMGTLKCDQITTSS